MRARTSFTSSSEIMRRMKLLLVLLLATKLQQVNAVVDDWHKAAAEADEDRYFAHMTSAAVFMGTDATERWNATEFREYAHPYFAKGKAWTFIPHDRHVISQGDDVGWFDEKLDSESYGELRGSGVLIKMNDEWKIAHYNLSIPIPNSIAKNVVV